MKGEIQHYKDERQKSQKNNEEKRADNDKEMTI
jgi:hypothetical protein